jgi:hypothetical protein
MVRKQEACCAFMRFDLREERGTHLTIVVPQQAREAANEWLAHFAPELVRSQISSSPTQKEIVL